MPPPRPRVVFDTNVLVSACIGKGLCFRLLEEAREERYQLYISPEILAETADVLGRPRFRLHPRFIRQAIRYIAACGTVIEATQSPVVVTDDPDDDRIVACALTCRARFLASHDHHLLDLRSHKGVLFVTPRQLRYQLTRQPVTVPRPAPNPTVRRPVR